MCERLKQAVLKSPHLSSPSIVSAAYSRTRLPKMTRCDLIWWLGETEWETETGAPLHRAQWLRRRAISQRRRVAERGAAEDHLADAQRCETAVVGYTVA